MRENEEACGMFLMTLSLENEFATTEYFPHGSKAEATSKISSVSNYDPCVTLYLIDINPNERDGPNWESKHNSSDRT